MTTSTISSRSRLFQILTAIAILVVSGRLAYSLVLSQLWLTLAIVGVKTCFTLALLLLLDRPHRAADPNLLSSLLVLLLMFASMFADLAVATLIH